MSESLHHFLPVKRRYPKDAVGIENSQKEVMRLLNMIPEDESKVVVVVYGFGGIGKTTLANSVAAMLNLDSYNYARVQFNDDNSKNNLKELQEVILKDAFPCFHSGAALRLRDCQDGRDHLTEAFSYVENKPVFLHIDNAQRSEDLKELFPEDLSNLPKRSRILLTTRKLDATDIFLNSGLTRQPFAMKTLEDIHAVDILCKDADNRERIEDDMERILRICGGVPLALRIVGGHLAKMGYNAGKCSQILRALEEGDDIKEENLTGRLIDFVYNELEEGTKDAFLDICCFFDGQIRREVEYIVGAQEVKSLEEAALVTPFVDDSSISSMYAGEECLSVHPLLRAKGQRMSTFTRFTDVESFCEAAQDETKLNQIKGLWLDNSISKDWDSEYELDVKHLNLMRHSLRILVLGDNTRTSAQSSMKFKELRYLEVDPDIPHLPMKLEELDMLGYFMGPDIFPKGICMYKLPKRLSKMCLGPPSETLAASEESNSTEAIHYHSLEELSIQNDIHLQEGLHQLSSLKILSVDNVNEHVEEFPEQVCELSSLIKLSIGGWTSLPKSFGRLKRLTHLEMRQCFELELPWSFGELTALEHLILTYCPNLKKLPDGLESLKYLYVYDCGHLSMELYQSKPDLRIVRNDIEASQEERMKKRKLDR